MSGSSTPARDRPAEAGRAARGAVLTVYVTAMCMNGLDATIVNPALFSIAADLGVGPAAANLVEGSFLASLAVSMPVAGWLCDRYGAARVFLAALALFTAASALCGLAWNLDSLVGFRVLQGVGGGVLTPAGMTMLFTAYAPEERMRLSRYIVVPTALAPALGPVLGGLLADHLSWRWAFHLNVPFGVAAVLLGLAAVRVPSPGAGAAGRFDLRGLLLAASGFGLLMYGLGEAAAGGWASPWVIAALAAGAVLTALLVPAERTAASPLLDLRPLADRGFLRGAAAASLAAAGLMGMLFVFPLMYQDALGASASEAGLVVFPEALGLMAAGFAVDRVCARWGERRVTALGLLGGAALFTVLALAAPGPWALRAIMFSVGLVLGHAVTAVQISAFDGVGPEVMGRAMTLFQSLRMLGGALGVGVCALAVAAGYPAALLVSAAFLAAAFLAAVLLTPAAVVARAG
ncbi:DHA2 family efflux MFS transporter permease subunit [Planomonospora sp. ID82291]|uniref:DHA2 family efflux MFS transporter permease subunit n=1 Tax=Planomonospora sp. ID82291 TaxID=2738136 RepID=UPI0018C37304|nr:DHA2 family efflux MFS transporter permease subunit [Planomonospora sp. ID82291]